MNKTVEKLRALYQKGTETLPIQEQVSLIKTLSDPNLVDAYRLQYPNDFRFSREALDAYAETLELSTGEYVYLPHIVVVVPDGFEARNLVALRYRNGFKSVEVLWDPEVGPSVCPTCKDLFISRDEECTFCLHEGLDRVDVKEEILKFEKDGRKHVLGKGVNDKYFIAWGSCYSERSWLPGYDINAPEGVEWLPPEKAWKVISDWS